jgi:hypothetical protein
MCMPGRNATKSERAGNTLFSNSCYNFTRLERVVEEKESEMPKRSMGLANRPAPRFRRGSVI